MNCTILLIDDHALFRAGLRLMLANALSDTEIREALAWTKHWPVAGAAWRRN
jgi:DNA-binding NarL/FixJ family response regulator